MSAAPMLASERRRGQSGIRDRLRSAPRDDSMLTIHVEPQGLRRPVLILAWAGWNDAAEAATTAARYLATSFHAEKFAEIDPEEFYHFGLSRPAVRFRAGSETERELVWPTTEFSIAQSPDLARDLIVGVATEPHLRWKAYCGAVLELARRCHVSLVLTLGALLAEVPHTRPVPLLGATLDLGDLDEAIKQFEANLAEIVAQNAKIAGYIRKLESKAAEEQATAVPPAAGSDLPPAAELVAEIEQFLRQQRPE